MFIQNRMLRAFYLPECAALNAPQILIGPGETVSVDPHHFDAVRTGNQAIMALLDLRHLVASDTMPGNDEPALKNTTVEVPAYLEDEPDTVTRTAKVETVEVSLDAGPAEAPRKGRRA